MATLVSLPEAIAKQFTKYVYEKDVSPMIHIEKEQAALVEVQKNHKLLQVPYADGYAIYLIVSEKPLRIAHIPFGDAWHLPATFIRGLRLKDIRFTDWNGSVSNIGRVAGGGLPVD